MLKVGKYIREIGSILIGFYLMGIVFAYSQGENKSFFDVVNLIGVFLSSIGVVAAILTVTQQHYINKNNEIRNIVNSSNSVMFKIGKMLNTYGNIKLISEEDVESENPKPKLLDGQKEDWIIDIDFDRVMYISELNSEIYADLYLMVFNYNRYIASVFRWQENQSLHTTNDNRVYFNQFIERLDIYGTPLIILNNDLRAILRTNYPEETFFYCEIKEDEFKNLQFNR